jgi:hypothetical protein
MQWGKQKHFYPNKPLRVRCCFVRLWCHWREVLVPNFTLHSFMKHLKASSSRTCGTAKLVNLLWLVDVNRCYDSVDTTQPIMNQVIYFCILFSYNHIFRHERASSVSWFIRFPFTGFSIHAQCLH